MTDIKTMLKECLREARGEEVAKVLPLPGGANSFVFKIKTGGGRDYLAKQYLRRPGDIADRLETEFSGLAFLWSHGIRSIPEPVCSRRLEMVGVYGFIEGEKLRPGVISGSDIGQALEFLKALHALREAPGTEAVPPAKEACFTLNAYLDVLDGRLRKLRALPASRLAQVGLGAFLADELEPFLAEARALVVGAGLDPARELPREHRTLSPSDFGFHNAIKRPDGRIVFIDFEYWGWDDPAKMIADFFLQPAVPVPPAWREDFYRQAMTFLGPDPELPARLPLVYLLLALKWSLIMLNPFLRPEETEADILERQVSKAGRNLRHARRELTERVFPLSLP